LSREIGRRAQRRTLLRLIDRVFEVDPGIRFVALYQDQYIIAGGMRKGRSSLDPEEEAHDIDLQLARIGEITHSWQKWFGSLDTLAMRYEKLSLAYVPLKEGRFLVISADTGLNPFNLLEKMKGQLDFDQLSDSIP